MNVMSIERNKSGSACSRCSTEPGRVTTVIRGHRVVLLLGDFRRSSEGSRGGPLTSRRHAQQPGHAVRHVRGLNSRRVARIRPSPNGDSSDSANALFQTGRCQGPRRHRCAADGTTDVELELLVESTAGTAELIPAVARAAATARRKLAGRAQVDAGGRPPLAIGREVGGCTSSSVMSSGSMK